LQCWILRSPDKAAFRIEAIYWSILKWLTSTLIHGAQQVESAGRKSAQIAPYERPVCAPYERPRAHITTLGVIQPKSALNPPKSAPKRLKRPHKFSM